MKIITLFSLCVLLLTASCASEVKKNDQPNQPEQPVRPDWIDQPEPNFVGKCTTHVNSVAASEQCAYKNAIAYITTLKRYPSDSMASVTIVDRWHDDVAGIMYVLIKEN